ncbi:unnamed protein product [Diatraea saccharalis]|uniref:Peptidase S1 domain-containing protein n=1 Tax=Diatraea saccharalis TaxID=40085 RepID=A0A9N9WHZ6_9NEOP|nr:unnamed protein product [Diatraea saccharalis]
MSFSVGIQSFVVDKNGGAPVRPNQQNRPNQPNYDIYYTERTTQQPIYNQFTTQRKPIFNPHTTQPPPPFEYNPYTTQQQQPQPDYNPYTTQQQQSQPDYNRYTTQRQPPPDYNPYTTEPSQQPPPDYNPYTTKQPPQPPPDFNPPFNPPSTQSGQGFAPVQCGVVAGGNERQPLIHNGQNYERGAIPWLIAIYKRKDGSLTFNCAGTLISDRHIVTAAHCILLKNSMTSIKDIVVKIGVYNLEDWGDDQIITRTLESAVIHESYNSSTLANDLAVFTLDKTVDYSINIRPACLWDGQSDLNRIVGASGVVAGWGSTELGPGGHGVPRMVRIPVVSTSMCRASKPDFHKLTSDTTFCAGDRNGIGPCLGDSGGGLYILDSGRWRLRGVVSVSLRPDSGENTCDLNQFIVFTDAAKYTTWIRNIVKSSQI